VLIAAHVVRLSGLSRARKPMPDRSKER